MPEIRDAAPAIDAELFGDFAKAIMGQLWPVLKTADSQQVRDLIARPARLKAVLGRAFPPKIFINFCRSVTVDYEMPIEQAIKLGNCHSKNSYISSVSFPVRRKKTAELEVGLTHTDRPISTEAILRMIDKEEYRPAELRAVLPLGAIPDLPRKFPIVALGSFWRTPSGHRRVAVLYANNSGWDVDLETIDEKIWPSNWQFAVVAKEAGGVL